MESQNQHAKDILPEEALSKEVLAKHNLLPNRSRNHDQIQGNRFDDNRYRSDFIAIAGKEVANDQTKTDDEDEKLNGSKNPLY